MAKWQITLMTAMGTMSSVVDVSDDQINSFMKALEFHNRVVGTSDKYHRTQVNKDSIAVEVIGHVDWMISKVPTKPTNGNYY